MGYKKPGVKQRVLARDGYRCRYCGRRGHAAALSVDHIIAAARGGSHAQRDLVTACRRCNGTKGNRRLHPIDEMALLTFVAVTDPARRAQSSFHLNPGWLQRARTAPPNPVLTEDLAARGSSSTVSLYVRGGGRPPAPTPPVRLHR